MSRIVYISQQNASPQTRFLGGQDHYLSEQYLKATGVPSTILRDNFYVDEIPARFAPHGVFRGAVGQGSVAWVSREDIAQVAATILSSPQSSNGVYDVTGPEALTLPETARRLSVLAGRDLRYEEESMDELRAQLAAQGVEPFQIEAYLGFCMAIRAGEFAPVSDTVARFTGRAPFSLEAYFAAYPHLLDKIRAPVG